MHQRSVAKQILSQVSVKKKEKQWKSKLCVKPHYKVICYDMIYYTYMHSSMIYMHVNTNVDIPLSIAQLLTILDADAGAGVDAELSLCLASLHVGHLLILCKYQIVLR